MKTSMTSAKMLDLHSDFYLQRVLVSKKYLSLDRLALFSDICRGVDVLHVGCTQYPITNIETSLHVGLSKVCRRLDGYDTDVNGYSTLAPHINNGRFLDSISDAASYDLVIIPEVMEHVGNVETFLQVMNAIDTKKYVITVPDLYQCMAHHFCADSSSDTFFEAVHPDHNYWFSPYTLQNVIKKYTNWRLDGLFWVNNISIMAICTKEA